MNIETVLAVIRRCELEEPGGLSPAAAAVTMKQIVLNAVRALGEEEDANPPIVTAIRPAGACHRGPLKSDDDGTPFRHETDPHTHTCIWCGDGSPAPPPEAYDKPVERRIETVGCDVHGSHALNIRSDGSYDKPDCEMFK